MSKYYKPAKSAKRESPLASLNTYDDLRAYLETAIAPYRARTYAEEPLQTLCADRQVLTRLRKALNQRYGEWLQSRAAPGKVLNAQHRELKALIDEPLDRIQAQLSQAEEREKDKRQKDLRKHFKRISTGLGGLADLLYQSPAFLDRRWENPNMSPKKWKTLMQSRVNQAALDLQAIQTSGGEDTPALLARYLETMDMRAVLRHRKTLEKVRKAGNKAITPEKSEDNVVGWRTLTLHGTAPQMARMDKQLAIMGIRFEERENGMPQPLQELTEPDFDTFVCFDTENSGTFGIANGDSKPPEIMEIGAVRVERGEIVDRKSWLCNPGRKIVPTVVKLTGITNEMVAEAPPVSEVIRQFADYIDGLPIVGHGIKGGDLPFLLRAAGREGIALNSPYFDTYLYAERYKEEQGWDGVGLDTLAQRFGIPHPNAHRALGDAEANAAVYLELRRCSASASHEVGLAP